MDRKQEELHKLFSDMEKDIASLKLELKQAETRNQKLQEEAMYHVAKICPDYYKRIFGELSKNMLDPSKSDLENMFVDQDANCKNILGYSCTVEECSYEEIGNILLRKWEVQGAVGDNTFIVQFWSEIDLEETSPDKNEVQKIEVKSIEIFPHSYVFDGLAAKLLELDHGLGLRALVPCLYTYQRLIKERDMCEEKLSFYEDIVMTEENGTLLVDVVVDDSFQFRIEWDISFRERGYNFFSDFIIKIDEMEAKRRFEKHPDFPYLKGEESLMNGEDLIRLMNAIRH